MEHIVREVMGQADNSPIEQCFRDMNYKDPADIFGMDEEAIQGLSHCEITTGEGMQTITHHPLSAGYKGRV